MMISSLATNAARFEDKVGHPAHTGQHDNSMWPKMFHEQQNRSKHDHIMIIPMSMCCLKCDQCP